MGGINHKPTKDPMIAFSALLSRAACEGLVAVHQANIAIEDAILADLSGQSEISASHVTKAIELMTTAVDKVDAIVTSYDRMIEAARTSGYEGNPLASRVTEVVSRDLFERRVLPPSIVEPAWGELVERISRDNLLPTFRWEQEQFKALRTPMHALIDVLRECRVSAEQGSLVQMVEHNRIPLRQRFMPVFSRWHYLVTMFLYSAAICTELYYHSDGLGTLVEESRPSAELRQREVESVAQ